MYKKITTPLDIDAIRGLKAGDRVLISGVIYSARDAAHKRMVDALEKGDKLPIDIHGQIIYYAGPCPPKPGHIAGPFGPTTSGRMDKYAPALIELGLKGMIGKGERSEAVVRAMVQEGAVYFAAVGGTGAAIAAAIRAQRVVDYEDLGAEALRELVVEDFPAIVAIDCLGNDLYKTEPQKYQNMYKNEAGY